MNVGDSVPVAISGITVGAGVVENMSDGKVSIVIPAQRVVMSMRVQLTDDTPADADTSGKEVIIEGVDRNAPVAQNDTSSDTSVEPVVQPVVEPVVQAGSTPNEPIKSPVTITGVDGRSYTLPEGTTLADLEEPAANE